MHIIFGKQTAEQMSEKYTLLELDRIQVEPDGVLIDTYCVVDKEQIPLVEVTQIENFKNLHNKLMENYRRKDWNFCTQALEHLHGRWGGSINSFYDEISSRIAKYKEQDPGADWDGSIKKYVGNTGN